LSDVVQTVDTAPPAPKLPPDRVALTRGLRTGGILNTFPCTSFSQEVGPVGATMLAMGLVATHGVPVDSVRLPVLGAGIVMVRMVAATGVRIPSGVDGPGNRNNLHIVAISIGFGLIALLAAQFSRAAPHALAPLPESGILLPALMAVVLLNLCSNGMGKDAAASARAQEAVH
jgi:NCS2 family nucleobase:cation symporter-2